MAKITSSGGSGIRALSKKLEETSAFSASLENGWKFEIDRSDPESVQKAIRDMEADVDEKAAAYPHNDMIVGVAGSIKEKLRQIILDRAAEPEDADGQPS